MTTATFAGAGDLLINRADPRSMLRHVADYFRNADIAYVNLEGPTADTGAEHPGMAGVGLHLRSTPGAVEALTDAGIDVVSLANNHAMDFGAAALGQTLTLLDKANIGHAGAGGNLAEARRPCILNVRGLRVALLSYSSVCVSSFAAGAQTPGVAMIRIDTTYEANLRLLMQPGSPMITRTTGNASDVAMLVEDIKTARGQADAVLVAWHWGVSERWGKLAEYQRVLGRAAIDAGADAVLGHHAHMLLGMEFYRNRPIFYSLGNFAFDMDHAYFRRESVIVRFDISRSGIGNIRLVPVTINDAHEPVLVDAEDDVRKLAWLLDYHSEGLNTRFVSRGGHIELLPASQ